MSSIIVKDIFYNTPGDWAEVTLHVPANAINERISIGELVAQNYHHNLRSCLEPPPHCHNCNEHHYSSLSCDEFVVKGIIE